MEKEILENKDAEDVEDLRIVVEKLLEENIEIQSRLEALIEVLSARNLIDEKELDIIAEDNKDSFLQALSYADLNDGSCY